MALKCVCFPVNEIKTAAIQGKETRRNQPKFCQDRPSPKTELDLCKILARTQDERNKHNDYECHNKGEKRQNLINKIKMFLDDYDDRPVMKRGSKDGASKGLGQTGYGPLIKYPGYVDYDHPYFSDPYNKMPDLAMTVKRGRGENPCPPISVRNWDETHGQRAGVAGQKSERGGSGSQTHSSAGRCHCAKQSGKDPRCPAAGSFSQTHHGNQGQWSQKHQYYSQPALQDAAFPSGGMQYLCCPLPD